MITAKPLKNVNVGPKAKAEAQIGRGSGFGMIKVEGKDLPPHFDVATVLRADSGQGPMQSQALGSNNAPPSSDAARTVSLTTKRHRKLPKP